MSARYYTVYGYQSAIYSHSVPYNETLNVPAFVPRNLSCVGAFPNERLTWLFNGRELIESEHINPETIRSNTLVFFVTSPIYSGLYSCQSIDTGATLSNYNVIFNTGKPTHATYYALYVNYV